MKKLFIVTIMLLLSAVSIRAKAEELKIGLVDFQRALNEVEEGKAAKARLKAEFDQKQKTLDALQNDLKTMKDGLEKQKLVLSQDAMKQKEGEYRDKFIELQKKLADFRGELQQKEAEYTGNIIQNLKQIVQEIGARDKYTLILERGGDVVLYSQTATDLTPQVIASYNSHPRPAPKPAPEPK
jgi:outer membrane protein